MNDIDRLSALLQAQAQRCCLFDQRISVLESMMPPPMPYEGDTMTHEAAPSPPAALVERMAEAIVGVQEPGWPVMDQDREAARAALRVAAEELLGDVTDEEWNLACGQYPREVRVATLLSAILKTRLARALEACR